MGDGCGHRAGICSACGVRRGAVRGDTTGAGCEGAGDEVLAELQVRGHRELDLQWLRRLGR